MPSGVRGRRMHSSGEELYAEVSYYSGRMFSKRLGINLVNPLDTLPLSLLPVNKTNIPDSA